MKTIRWDQNTLISVADYPGEQIIVNGRVWSFDYCKRLGPLWLKKDGTERKCQCPCKAVWAEFDRWLIKHGLNTN